MEREKKVGGESVVSERGVEVEVEVEAEFDGRCTPAC